MGICSCHKSPTTKHCVSRCPPHHCVVAISECFGRQRVNQLAKQPEIHVINMEYASSYAVWHELWMLCSACKICDGSTTATRCRICIWWAIWQCCIELIILAVGRCLRVRWEKSPFTWHYCSCNKTLTWGLKRWHCTKLFIHCISRLKKSR